MAAVVVATFYPSPESARAVVTREKNLKKREYNTTQWSSSSGGGRGEREREALRLGRCQRPLAEKRGQQSGGGRAVGRSVRECVCVC